MQAHADLRRYLSAAGRMPKLLRQFPYQRQICLRLGIQLQKPVVAVVQFLPVGCPLLVFFPLQRSIHKGGDAPNRFQIESDRVRSATIQNAGAGIPAGFAPLHREGASDSAFPRGFSILGAYAAHHPLGFLLSANGQPLLPQLRQQLKPRPRYDSVFSVSGISQAAPTGVGFGPAVPPCLEFD